MLCASCTTRSHSCRDVHTHLMHTPRCKRASPALTSKVFVVERCTPKGCLTMMMIMFITVSVCRRPSNSRAASFKHLLFDTLERRHSKLGPHSNSRAASFKQRLLDVLERRLEACHSKLGPHSKSRAASFNISVIQTAARARS